MSSIKKNTAFYIFGLLVVLSIKLIYRNADIEMLSFILEPTSFMVKLLSGISFNKVYGIGFINHEHRAVINMSCSGINFLIISFMSVYMLNIHAIKKLKYKLLWFPASLAVSYLYTIFINSLRIIVSIYLFNADIYSDFITPERVHRIEGAIIYIISLIILVDFIRFLFGKSKEKNNENSFSASFKYILPFLCYFFITIIIPLINSSYKYDLSKFIEHSATILLLSFLIFIIFILKRKIKNHSPHH
jgi:exosortase K